MKIIVDTNIVFSAILNSNGKIGELLIRSKDNFEFYSVNQIKYELSEHKSKILKLSKLSNKVFQETYEILFSKISIINDILIPKSELLKSERLLHNIDQDDTVFLALAFHLKAKLWTGDLKLINGLKNQDINQTITTDELYNYYLDNELFLK